jgi:uncharacterized protein
MQNRLPERVDPFSMADSSRRLSGQVPAGRLKRLASLLETTDSLLAIELAFGIGEQGIRTVSGIVRGELLLTCQRCLGRMRFPVDIDFTLALARSLEQAERSPAGLDPLIVDHDTVSIVEMVEDEVLLSLPLIPSHQEIDGGCAPGSADRLEDQGEATDSQASASPFAVLAGLKNRT